MKKVLYVILLSSSLFTVTSCKKWYTCTCTLSNGTVDWTGDVEATSKAKAESTLQQDCSGTVSCD